VRLKALIVFTLACAFLVQPLIFSLAEAKTYSETQGLEKAYWTTGSVLMTPVWFCVKTIYTGLGVTAGGVAMIGTFGVAHKSATKLIKNSVSGDWYVPADYLMGNKKTLDIYGHE